MFAAHRKLKV